MKDQIQSEELAADFMSVDGASWDLLCSEMVLRPWVGGLSLTLTFAGQSVSKVSSCRCPLKTVPKPTSCCLLGWRRLESHGEARVVSLLFFYRSFAKSSCWLSNLWRLSSQNLHKKTDFKNSPLCPQIPLTPVMLGGRCCYCLSHPVSPLVSTFLFLLSGSLCIRKG